MKTTTTPAPETGRNLVKSMNSFARVCAVALAVIFTACQEDEIAPTDPSLKHQTVAASPIAGGSAVSFTSASTFGTVRLDNAGIYYVEDFFQGTPGTGTDPHVPNATYYYRFDIVDGGTSSNYVLKFGGTANGDITVASGYTLAYTATNFNSVTSSTATTAVSGAFGYNNIVMGTPTNFAVNPLHPGWYNYNITNHVVYPLVDNGGSVTLVITNTSTGVKYKVEPQDIYQGGIPNSATPPNNYPYLKFRYKQL
jgi:hypothetical protein